MPSQLQHLTDDALHAEDIAIRYADSTHGLYSGHFQDIDDYESRRDRCMATLFGAIAINHRVTPEQVRESLTRRRLGPDLFVFISFGIAYALLAYAVGRRLGRRFPVSDGWTDAVIATGVCSLLFSVGGVMAGEEWSGLVEIIRTGNDHMSYRILRIPWAHHRAEVFLAGLAIFWMIALFCLRFKHIPAREAPGLLHLDV